MIPSMDVLDLGSTIKFQSLIQPSSRTFALRILYTRQAITGLFTLKAHAEEVPHHFFPKDNSSPGT